MSQIQGDRIAGWVSRFLQHPSPQTDLFEAEPQVLDFIANGFMPVATELGLPCRLDGMGNALVEIGDTRNGPSVLFLAYAMTHPAASMDNPFGGERFSSPEGDSVRGRGSCEQKGALGSALAATLAASEADDLNGSLTLAVCTAGETGRHDAARAVLAAMGHVPDISVVVVGTSGKVALGNKGRIDIEIDVRGRVAHSSAPWRGVDAIAGACQVIQRLGVLELPDTEHPELGRVTLTPTAVRSWPEATHTVQDHVHLTYDRRLLPGEDADAALSAVEDTIRGLDPWEVEVTLGPWMYPSEVAPDSEVARCARQGPVARGLDAPETFYNHGCLDAGFLNAEGSQAIMWGPGDVKRWHSHDETISVRDLVNGAESYYGFIRAHLASD